MREIENVGVGDRESERVRVCVYVCVKEREGERVIEDKCFVVSCIFS